MLVPGGVRVGPVPGRYHRRSMVQRTSRISGCVEGSRSCRGRLPPPWDTAFSVMASDASLQRAMDDARSGRIDSALATVRMLVRRRPDDQDAIALLGLLLTQSGQLDQAIHHLSRAVSLAPGLPGPRNNLANALVNVGRRPRLVELRRGLRARLSASPLLDGAGWSTRFFGALRDEWRAWCATTRPRGG